MGNGPVSRPIVSVTEDDRNAVWKVERDAMACAVYVVPWPLAAGLIRCVKNEPVTFLNCRPPAIDLANVNAEGFRDTRGRAKTLPTGNELFVADLEWH
jgi:hypothetical protein